MNKRLVKGTNSQIDGMEADCGPLLSVYKIENDSKSFLSTFREIKTLSDKEGKGLGDLQGIFIEDGYLIDIESKDFDEKFQHGRFIKEYSYVTKEYSMIINQFENTLQITIRNMGKSLFSGYKRPLYLPLLCSLFGLFDETDKMENILEELKQLL